jgi:hypothetical protein
VRHGQIGKRNHCTPALQRNGFDRSVSRFLQFGHHVIDGITNGFEVFQILIIDMETRRVATDFLFKRLNQLNEGQGIGIKIVNERRPLGDLGGFNLQNVSETITNDIDYSGAIQR